MENTRALRKAIAVLESRIADLSGRIELTEAQNPNSENLDHMKRECDSCVDAKTTLRSLLATFDNTEN